MNSIIAFALRLRALMVALFVLVMIGGVTAFVQLNIEAYPDPVPPLVDIVTQNPGQSAEEIERYITIPIEVDVAVAPYLTAMRTISLFGLSDVKLQFTYDLTYEEAEQKVLNRLSQLPALQNQAQPTISPWSPIGEIYRYQLVGPPGYSVMDLKTLQDWIIARRFRAVPGVIDVTGWGGKTKTFEIQIDRDKLVAYGLTLPQVLQTLTNSNINVGGNTRRRTHPLDDRHPEYDADGSEWDSGLSQRYRRDRRWKQTTPRHRRPRRTERHRSGNRAHATRAAEPTDDPSR